MDLAVDFMGQIRERYFTPNPKSVVRDPLVVYRDEGMQTLSRLKQAVYWMPPQLVQTLYENLFDTQSLENLRERNPEASPDDLEAMLALLKIKYLFSTGSEILGDELDDEEHHMSTFAKVMSFGAPAVASIYRYLALQIVFSLMLKEFSFGLVDEELAKKIAYGLALLGSIPQGFIEVAGNVAFCFGKQLTVGYMRDEVLSAIERQEKIFKGLTPEALTFFKSEICEGDWDR